MCLGVERALDKNNWNFFSFLFLLSQSSHSCSALFGALSGTFPIFLTTLSTMNSNKFMIHYRWTAHGCLRSSSLLSIYKVSSDAEEVDYQTLAAFQWEQIKKRSIKRGGRVYVVSHIFGFLRSCTYSVWLGLFLPTFIIGHIWMVGPVQTCQFQPNTFSFLTG